MDCGVWNAAQRARHDTNAWAMTTPGSWSVNRSAMAEFEVITSVTEQPSMSIVRVGC